jgi:DNA-binding NarL/FixJ family response regulator
MKHLIALLLLLAGIPLRANPEPHLLQEPLSGQVAHFEILPDSGYTLEQMRRMAFLPKQALDIHKNYWLRFIVQNPSHYSTQGYIWVFPPVSNTLYYYHHDRLAWVAEQAGLTQESPESVQRLMPCLFYGNSQDTFYIKAALTALAANSSLQRVNPLIDIVDAQEIHEKEALVWNIWLATAVVMSCFFLYNAYLYFFFRERTYLYYLIIVAGGLLYITGLNHYAGQFTGLYFFRLLLSAPNYLNWYNQNNVCVELGILAVMLGFIGFTRNYLQTQEELPAYDGWLKWAGFLTGIWILLSTGMNASGAAYIHHYTAILTNVAVATVSFLLMLSGFLSYRKTPKLARYFLIANMLPLLLVLVLAVYMAIFKIHGKISLWLPSMALVSQALALAVALVARVNLLKEELSYIRAQAQRLEHENEQMVGRNRFIEMENEYIIAEIALEKNQKEELQAKLEANQRELASNTLYLYQKNEMLSDLQRQIERLSQQSNTQHKEVIKEIKATLQNNLQLDADWERFRTHFEQVHPTFFQELLAKCPDLTPYDLRLAAYLHLNLSNKEIAVLLNITSASVRTAKMRLNKKLHPESSE